MNVRKVTIEIKSDEEVFRGASDTMKKIIAGKKAEKHCALAFDSIDQFRSIITPQRIRLLRIIREHKPSSIYKLAKLAGRDYANVHRDVEILERFDFLERGKQKLESCGKIEIGIKV